MTLKDGQVATQEVDGLAVDKSGQFDPMQDLFMPNKEKVLAAMRDLAAY